MDAESMTYRAWEIQENFPHNYLSPESFDLLVVASKINYDEAKLRLVHYFWLYKDDRILSNDIASIMIGFDYYHYVLAEINFEKNDRTEFLTHLEKAKSNKYLPALILEQRTIIGEKPYKIFNYFKIALFSILFVIAYLRGSPRARIIR